MQLLNPKATTPNIVTVPQWLLWHYLQSFGSFLTSSITHLEALSATQLTFYEQPSLTVPYAAVVKQINKQNIKGDKLVNCRHYSTLMTVYWTCALEKEFEAVTLFSGWNIKLKLSFPIVIMLSIAWLFSIRNIDQNLSSYS